MSNYKILLAHPGKQHAYRLAAALKKAGMLDHFITMVYDKRGLSLMSLTKFFLRGDSLKRANARKCSALDDDDVITFYSWTGLLETLCLRLDPSTNLYRWIHRRYSKKFGIKVAKYAIKHGVDAVIGYDANVKECFEYLKKKAPQIKRITDVSIAARPYQKLIFDKEIANSGHDDLRKANQYMWQEGMLQPFYDEIAAADYYLAASHFVKDSLVACGAQTDRVFIVPYGANVQSDQIERNISPEEPLRFLFVGQINYRKGVPYILEAVSSFSPKIASLTVTGDYDPNLWFVNDYKNKENIEFTGFVTSDRIKKIYEGSHVFVLPSFAEGMAQVGIEAMACGLPIICTYNSGVADLVSDGENGFVIPCGDLEALKEKMQWFIDNRQCIQTMGKKAKQVASGYGWDNYEINVIQKLKNIISSK